MKDSTVVKLVADKIVKDTSPPPTIIKRLEEQEKNIKEMDSGITGVYFSMFVIFFFLVIFSISSFYQINKLKALEAGMRNEIETLKEMLAEVLVSWKKSYYFIPQKERRIDYGY